MSNCNDVHHKRGLLDKKTIEDYRNAGEIKIALHLYSLTDGSVIYSHRDNDDKYIKILTQEQRRIMLDTHHMASMTLHHDLYTEKFGRCPSCEICDSDEIKFWLIYTKQISIASFVGTAPQAEKLIAKGGGGTRSQIDQMIYDRINEAIPNYPDGEKTTITAEQRDAMLAEVEQQAFDHLATDENN